MTLLQRAERAVEVIGADPREGTALANAVLRDPTAGHEALSVAERALGLASRDLGRFRQRVAHLEASVAHARAARSAEREADSRSTLAIAWLEAGDARRALREADLAVKLAGPGQARPSMSRALVLQRLGRDAEALLDYGRALRAAHRAGDHWSEARLLSNRGVLHAYRGEFAAAERDLSAAHELHEAAGAELASAEVLHNLGFVLAQRGDMPGALARYDEAGRAFAALGIPRTDALADRCEVLLAVRLLPEARRVAQAAVEGCEAAGRTADAAEARLMLARACLLEGDPEAARATAAAARIAFTAHRRANWSTLAELVELQAAAATAPAPDVEREAKRLARRLARGGWAVPALECLLLAARAALDNGRLGAARAALAAAPAARLRGPAALRVRAWHAEALLRLANGDVGGALAALRRGLRVADEYRATLGATELRVRAGAVGAELAELGTSLAIASGRPAEVLAWAERWHARLLEHPSARPPQDHESARLLGLLRQTVSQIGSASLEGEDTAALVRRQYSLEVEIRRRSLAVQRGRPAPPGERGGVPTVGALRDRLGPERALVEIVADRGQLAAVVVTGRKAQLVPLGRAAEAERERASLLFALGRLARRRSPPDAQRAAAVALGHAAGRLDELLLAPLAAIVRDLELIVVPSGELHALAWSLMPSVRGRPLTVAPSATQWLEREGLPSGRQERGAASGNRPGRAGARPAALVAGPGVAGAPGEIARVRETCYPAADVIGPAEATCARVGDAFERAALVHVAAHGEFRADNPLFSCLLLADGPLTVYDMESLRSAPSCLVLSACDAGLSTAPHGGEPMGPMAALLGIGTRSLVASVTPVPDDGAAEFMLAFHGRLVAGQTPARALAAAQEAVIDGAVVPDRVADDDPALPAAIAAAGYVCFGSG